MKNLILLFTLIGAISFVACNDDDNGTDEMMPDYHAHIMSPTTDDKNVGDTIHIHVDFEDHNGGTVHHVNVRIYNKATGDEIYNAPADAHVHDESGAYEFHDDVLLDVDAHSDWILEAKIWGHEAGEHEEMESIEFHVHPQ